MARRNRGISMAELMLVLAIAAILSIFFVYSSRSLVVRTKISRVKEEQRQLARAIQNYQIDYSTLPDVESGLQVLAQSHRYVSELPKDPFQKAQGTYAYLTGSFTDGVAVIISPGPDGDVDVPAALRPYVSFKGFDIGMVMPVSTSSMTAFGSDPEEATKEYLKFILADYIESQQYDPAKGGSGDLLLVIGQ